MEKYIAIGRLGKSHGLAGEIKIQVKDRYWEDFIESEVLFIEQQGKPVPFFILDARTIGKEVVIQLDDVPTREASLALAGKEVFLREIDLLPDDQARPAGEPTVIGDRYELLTGYSLHEVELGFVGVIEEVLELPGQLMAVLTYQEREVLIPLTPVFIQSIDPKQQVVVMDLPEGLLDL
ncbi:MAG: hypothetical protein H6555_01755 [Lewinellaceae bacterium]|nr:hypothetical protein [Lewinellaceae bacterium]